jgi:DNA-binding transcriptional LysR family regulator
MNRRQPAMSLDSLRVLDTIERRGSFAAAAQELCVVTSAITYAIRNLEQDLGLNLFDRSGRRARFTREGRLLLERGRDLLARAADFDAEVQLIATGWEARLVLAVDQVLCMEPLLPLIAAFFREAPQTSLQLRREAAAGSWDALLAGRADLVIGAPANGPAGGGYESSPLYHHKFVLVAAPGHPLSAFDGVIPDRELARHRAVVVGDTARGLPHLHYGILNNRDILAVPDTATKLAAILMDVGFGFVPAALARPHLRAGRLALLRGETPPPPTEGRLAWRAGENGRALKWWIDHLSRPALAKKLLY